MESSKIKEYLVRLNPWWQENSVREDLQGFRRDSYLGKIESNFDRNRVICLTGLRRVGKSTLMFQAISDLINKIESKKLVYVKLDDFDSDFKLKDLLDVYEQISGFDVMSDNIYFFLDEVQNINNWQVQLKYYVDLKSKSNFVCSGSSRTLLYKGSRESLLGRIKFIDVFPLSFREFLKFSCNDVSNYIKSISKLEDVYNLKSLEKDYYSLLNMKNKLISVLDEYIRVGGFPEWFFVRDDFFKWKNVLVDEYFNLFLYKDIVRVFNIRNPRVLEMLTKELAILSTNRISYLKLAEKLDTDRESVKNYISYLESSGIILVLDKYTKNKLSNEKSSKKIVFWEEGLRSAISGYNDIGSSVEGICSWHLYKLGLSNLSTFKPYFYYDKEESDFIYEKDSLFNIEIKYRNSINKNNLRGFFDFKEKFKPKYNIVLTKDDFKFEDDVLYLPVWFFLVLIE